MHMRAILAKGMYRSLGAETAQRTVGTVLAETLAVNGKLHTILVSLGDSA